MDYDHGRGGLGRVYQIAGPMDIGPARPPPPNSPLLASLLLLLPPRPFPDPRLKLLRT